MSKYPFDALRVGESFTVDCPWANHPKGKQRIHQAASRYRTRAGVPSTFSITIEEDGDRLIVTRRS